MFCGVSALHFHNFRRCIVFRRILSNGFEFPNIDNITKVSYNNYKKLRQGTKIPTIFCIIRRNATVAETGGFSDDFDRDRSSY